MRPEQFMRLLAMPLVAALLAGCSTAPEARPAPAVGTERQDGLANSTREYLLTSAAKDFQEHPKPPPTQFRDVRFGQVPLRGGGTRYLLCGQFLAATEGGPAEWTSFVTIKTSGYEQWLGAPAEQKCAQASIVWSDAGDLTAELQHRVQSLR